MNYLLTNLLTSGSIVILEKLTVPQSVKNFPTFHENQRFITMFPTACHLSLILGQINPVHNTLLYTFKICFNIILQSVLKIFTWFFVSGFATKTLCAFLFFPTLNTYLTHLILHDLMA